MSGLRAVLGRFFQGAPDVARAARLPQEINEFLAQKRLRPLQDWLERLLKASPDAPERALLLSEMRRLGWPDKDVEKLEIFSHYYRGDLQEAYRCSESHAAGGDFDADLFIIASFSLYYLSRFEDAWRLLESAGQHAAQLAGRSDYSIAAALICQSANDPAGMKRHIDQARRLAPDDAAVAINAYAMYFELGEMEAFARVEREIRELRYPIGQAGFALAVVELAQDKYQEGFRLLEERYEMATAHRYLNRGLFHLPRWRGEPLAGKTLLVSAEQGLGDTVQMARYLPELVRQGGRVVMETQPETLSLLQYNYPGMPLVERKYAVSPGLTFDLWTGAMSLPHLLGATAENIPDRSGYLRVPPENADYWHGRVRELAGGGRPRIGLAWSGQPTHRADRRRSVPFPRMMEAIRDVDADFFALQTQVPAIHPANLIDVSAEMVTLADTAALIAEMDLVITVDTSVVHVAGAIGRQAWLLLPYRYEWRWGLEGEGNHWYDSVRVIRQPATGDWDSVLREAFLRRLPEFVADKGGGPCPG